MKKILTLIAIFAFLFANNVFANNLAITNFSLSGQNTTDDYVMVEFDISWDNSWRTSTAPNNWDAAWLFVKYKTSDGVWHHATLNTTTTNHDNGSQTTSATMSQSDGTGLFYHRSGNGTGQFASTDVKLRWQYGTDGITDDIINDVATVQVFAIEMVYVPEGNFEVGDGGSTSRFHQGDNSANSLTISSESALRLGNDNSTSLWATGAWTANVGDMLSADYPKGFCAFYCMKYEITQEQYVVFLNTLTRTQQDTRTGTDVTVTSVTNRYVMSNNSAMQYRNGIRCDGTIHASDPITFYCDYNGNGTGNESGDGQDIACNYLSWADGASYSDWSGLRPMTEMEFEKACRGTASVINGEFAWGNTDITGSAYALNNTAQSNENITTITYDNSGIAGNGSYNTTNSSINGPLRVGIFAGNSNNIPGDRVKSGASYYGIMELSGNLWECTVTVGGPEGRTFTGTSGDGILDGTGNADVLYWPGIDALGSGSRGGDFYSIYFNCGVSNRTFAAPIIDDITIHYCGGLRCVRFVEYIVLEE